MRARSAPSGRVAASSHSPAASTEGRWHDIRPIATGALVPSHSPAAPDVLPATGTLPDRILRDVLHQHVAIVDEAIGSCRCAEAQSLMASMPSRLSSSRWFRMLWSISGECGAQSKISSTTRSGSRVR